MTDESELSFLKLFLTDQLLNSIVTETNIYGNNLHVTAQQQAADHPSARMLKWSEVDHASIWRYLALCFTMGIIRKPNLELYWTTNPLFQTPSFGQIMSCNRFQEINTALHFNHGDPVNGDRLHKIRPFYDMITRSFTNAYLPAQSICIDESLYLYKGRIGFRQYNPHKRARYGFKSYELCEASSGYCWKFMLYTGEDLKLLEHDKSVSASHAVVTHLLSGLEDLGYTLAIDNWYTSPQLLCNLSEKHTNCCGTVRQNRKGMPPPDEITKHADGSQLKKGEKSVFSSEHVTCVCWRDRKYVTMLSNFQDGTFADHPVRLKGGVEVLKPKVVLKYNAIMGGVDFKDQMVKAYTYFRKSHKWYKRIVFTLLEVAMFNAFCLWKKSHQDAINKSFLHFRQAVITQILAEAGPDPTGKTRVTPPLRGEPLLRLTERHFPSLNPPTEKRPVAFKQCRVCNPPLGHAHKRGESRKRVETKFQCEPCGNVPLCAAPCFMLYHTVRNLENVNK